MGKLECPSGVVWRISGRGEIREDDPKLRKMRWGCGVERKDKKTDSKRGGTEFGYGCV